MRARAAAHLEGGRLVVLRSEAPVVVRPAGPGLLYLTSGAGGPLGGDVLSLELAVGDDDHLAVRSVAAQVVLPDAGARPSRFDVTAAVGAGGSLDWRPEPTVLVRGCDHHAVARVALGDEARLTWVDELVLGRSGEPGGTGSVRTRVTLGGRALIDHALSLHPASIGAARAVVSAVLVDARWGAAPPPVALRERGARLPAAGPAVVVVGLGDDLTDARRVAASLGCPPA